MSRQQRRSSAALRRGRGSGTPRMMGGRRNGKLAAYVFTGITVFIALSMALPFCSVAGR